MFKDYFKYNRQKNSVICSNKGLWQIMNPNFVSNNTYLFLRNIKLSSFACAVLSITYLGWPGYWSFSLFCYIENSDLYFLNIIIRSLFRAGNTYFVTLTKHTATQWKTQPIHRTILTMPLQPIRSQPYFPLLTYQFPTCI